MTEVLKRQIAEKPCWEGEGEHIHAFCPHCGAGIDVGENCESCGQEIDWS